MSFLHKFIGTAGGLGFAPFAPGTFGSLGGLFTGWLILQFSGYPQIILLSLILLFFFAGVFSSNKIIPEWGDDPSRIVIDEVVGTWIAMLFLPLNIWILLASFIGFRFFDIYKPLGIRRFEKCPKGWGIMLDDVAAGFATNVVIQLVILINTSFL